MRSPSSSKRIDPPMRARSRHLGTRRPHAQRHSDSPQLDAEVLFSTVLGVARSALIARGSDLLADHELCAPIEI